MKSPVFLHHPLYGPPHAHTVPSSGLRLQMINWLAGGSRNSSAGEACLLTILLELCSCDGSGFEHIKTLGKVCADCGFLHMTRRYYAAPTMHQMLLAEAARRGDHRKARLRLVGNAAGPLLPSLAQALKSTFW